MEIPTLPISQCHSQHILYLKGCWGLHSYRRAAKKGRQVFGTHMVYRETFSQNHMLPPQHLIHKNWIHGVQPLRSRAMCLLQRKVERPEQNRDLRCQSGPSAKDSVIFSGGDSSKNYGSRPTTTADFWSPLWQVPYTSNLRLLEDKVQDRGMYLFTISYGSDAMDQRSGDVWFSGWFNVFVIYSWYFNAEFWSSWCEDCFGTEQNHP